jgi:hypothetical protein
MSSFIRRLSLEDRATSWECSYVMSTGDGVNLFGRLDVDMNRARFVAAAGMFGTACREAQHGGHHFHFSLFNFPTPLSSFFASLLRPRASAVSSPDRTHVTLPRPPFVCCI